MLTITIINDLTGTDESTNYTYLVRSHYKVIDSGRIAGHNRDDGWRVLALEAVAPGMLEACKAMANALRNIRDWGPGLIAQHGDALDGGLRAIAKVEREGE